MHVMAGLAIPRTHTPKLETIGPRALRRWERPALHLGERPTPREPAVGFCVSICVIRAATFVRQRRFDSWSCVGTSPGSGDEPGRQPFRVVDMALFADGYAGSFRTGRGITPTGGRAVAAVH